MPTPARITPQHIAIQELIANQVHKFCTVPSMQDLWRAAFRDKLEWKHFRSGNRYLYLGLTWNTELDEWAVQYARVDRDVPGNPITFTRSVSSFFSTVIDGDLNEVLRFTPWEDA